MESNHLIDKQQQFQKARIRTKIDDGIHILLKKKHRLFKDDCPTDTTMVLS